MGRASGGWFMCGVSTRRRTTLVIVFTLLAASVSALAPRAAKAVGGYNISTDGRPAVVRNGPGTNNAQVGALNNGTPIDIACQATGGPAYTNNGSASYVWDQLA